MNFFDFSSEVERAVTEAEDETARLCARTNVGRRLIPVLSNGLDSRFCSRKKHSRQVPTNTYLLLVPQVGAIQT